MPDSVSSPEQKIFCVSVANMVAKKFLRRY